MEVIRLEKGVKASLLVVLILGLGLVYVGAQVNSLQDRADELDWLMIDSGVTIDNGTGTTTNAVHLTRGATALEALQRTATVETKIYPGQGAYITEINGVHENKSAGKYWMIYRWNEQGENWSMLQVGAGSYELEEGDNIKFSYEKPPW